jgi:hypothetical protein
MREKNLLSESMVENNSLLQKDKDSNNIYIVMQRAPFCSNRLYAWIIHIFMLRVRVMVITEHGQTVHWIFF